MKKIILFILLLFISVSFIVPKSQSVYANSKSEVYYISVDIEQGDTLSSLASKYNRASMDTNQYARHIKRFNKMRTDTLVQGSSIIVPVFVK